MDPGLLFLCAVALILGAILLLREPARLKEALGLSCGYGQRLIFHNDKKYQKRIDKQA